MTDKARWLVYVLFASMGSIWLNGCAVILVVSGNGGPGLAPPVAAVVHLAYLPCRFWGIPQEHWFFPNLLGPIILNVLTWVSLGIAVAAVHHGIARTRGASRRTTRCS